jgi:hypothetical protein
MITWPLSGLAQTFNAKMAIRSDAEHQGGLFHDEQFRRAIQEGSIAILRDEIRERVLDAYGEMEAANGAIRAAWRHGRTTNLWHMGVMDVQLRIVAVQPKIKAASDALLGFLGSESPVA